MCKCKSYKPNHENDTNTIKLSWIKSIHIIVESNENTTNKICKIYNFVIYCKKTYKTANDELYKLTVDVLVRIIDIIEYKIGMSVICQNIHQMFSFCDDDIFPENLYIWKDEIVDFAEVILYNILQSTEKIILHP
jgi:hypothetical protein